MQHLPPPSPRVFQVEEEEEVEQEEKGFVDPHATTPSLRLVNKASLDRILQAEVYVNESDGQLRAAHLILGYNPISRAFQAPR